MDNTLTGNNREDIAVKFPQYIDSNIYGHQTQLSIRCLIEETQNVSMII